MTTNISRYPHPMKIEFQDYRLKQDGNGKLWIVNTKTGESMSSTRLKEKLNKALEELFNEHRE